jgi:flagellar motor switch protein FliG
MGGSGVSRDGIARSAILLMSIGEEEAGEVFKFLSPSEVQKVGQAMARLKRVSREDVAGALRAFRLAAAQQTAIGPASDQYLRSVLTRALGSDRAAALIDRILQAQDNRGIDSLKWMDAASVAELIRSEHPQIIATILAHLDPDQAAGVLSALDERVRNDVVLRIATLEGVQPAAMQDLNDVLSQLLGGGDQAGKSTLDGVEVAAEILNRMGPMEAAVSSHIREVDAQLAQRIEDRMFLFDDLLDLDDRDIQLLLREVQSETLVVALKGAGDALQDKFFRNMSQRAAEMLREDVEAKGPVRLSEVEAEQREILRIAHRLAGEGLVVLGGRGAASLVG